MTIALKPMKWSELTHVDDVEPLGTSDEQVMEDIRNVLERHDALSRFGIFLVHKHFELAPDEYILETTDEDAREQRLSVVRGDNPDENTIQTMWQFDKYGETAVTQCVLRCHYDSGHKQRHKREGS
jgi:hypothetical protein